MKRCVLVWYVAQMRHSTAIRKSLQGKLLSLNLKADRPTPDTERICLDFTINITEKHGSWKNTASHEE
jgi:hypothetical protein